jgi:nucleoside-diphosphate-sugar epimerase
MKIAIIGFGWIGHPLGIKLQTLGYEIVGTTTSDEKILHLRDYNLPAICWSSRESDFQFHPIFENTDCVVLNFPPGRQTEFKSYGEHLRKVVKAFPSSTKFIFISSTSVYPDEPYHFKEEDVTIDERAKENNIAYAEWVLTNELDKNRFTIIRMAGLVGGERHPARFFAGRENIPNGNHPVNLIYRKDAVHLIENCIQNNIWGEVINGCASFHPSKSEYYIFACDAFGLDKPNFLMSENGKSISNEKSKVLLDYKYIMDTPFDYWKVNL